MPTDVTLAAALFAGLISFLSPCVLPLVPPYLCYLAGVTLDQLSGEAPEPVARRTVFLSSLAFVLGFTTVFIILGATASAISRLVSSYLDILSVIGGGIIIIMGLHFLGVFRIGLLFREKRLAVRNNPAGPPGAYLFGVAFAVAWTPCIGPILGTILLIAGSDQTLGHGAALLAVYSLGLGVPFLLAGIFAGPFMRLMRRFRGHLGGVEKAMGAFLVVTGVLFVTGHITTFSFWIISLFPGLANLG